MGKKLLLILFINFTLLIFSLSGGSFGCGSSAGGDSPTVIDANDAAITASSDASATVGIYPTSFTITFSDSLSDTSAAADAVSLACGDLTPTISTECSGSSCEVTVTEAWRYGRMECTLTVGTGAGLSSASTHAFTNACAVSDGFNAVTISGESSSCWGIADYDDRTLTSWSDISEFASFNVANSSLDVDFTGSDGDTFTFTKEVSVSDDFEIEIYFSSISGMTSESSFGVVLCGSASITPSYQVQIGSYTNTSWNESDDPMQSCNVSEALGGGEMASYGADCTADTGYYIKLTKSGDIFTQQYRVEDDEEYSDLTWEEEDSSWRELELGGTISIEIVVDSEAGAPIEAGQIGYVKVTGMTVEGQY